MQVDGVTIPATMANMGPLYNWQPPVVAGKNGRGRVVEVGYPFLEWGWTWLSDSDWDYWVTTILSGARDALITGTTELYDDDKVLRTITSCVVYKPVHQTIRNGVHYGVSILIAQIVTS